MQLSSHINLCETDGVAEAETQNAWVGLHTGADEKILHSLIFQASSQANTLTFRVFLDFALSNEVLGELVGQPETHHNRNLLKVQSLLETEIDRIEDVGAKCQFVSNL